MIRFGRAPAALVNACLDAWGHYLGPQDGPRLVEWYALTMAGRALAVCVSGSPRGKTCAGKPWRQVCELVRVCAAPEHRDMTRVALRCWRKVAAQDFADAYGNAIERLAAYSDSSRHPGNIYRFDGWTLYDERLRGSGGAATRRQQTQALKRLWLYDVSPPAVPAQANLFSEATACAGS